MTARLIVAILICIHAVFGLQTTGRAATQSEIATSPICTTQGSPDAKALNFDLKDKITLKGLRYSIVLAPPVRPLERNTCVRAEFIANGEIFLMGGDANGSVVRIAAPRQFRKRVFVLQAQPYPKAALKWLHDNPSAQDINFPPEDLMYALVLFSLDSRQISFFRLYDRIPNDLELTQTMCDALSSTMSPVFTLGSESGIPNIIPGILSKPVEHADCHARFAAVQP